MDNHVPGAERLAFAPVLQAHSIRRSFCSFLLPAARAVTYFSRIDLLSVELTLGHSWYCLLATTCKTPLRYVENLVRLPFEIQYQEER